MIAKVRLVPKNKKRGRGKPPLGEKKRKHINVRMDPWVKEQMETIRRKEGTGLTQQIESAVRTALAERGIRQVKLRIRRVS